MWILQCILFLLFSVFFWHQFLHIFVEVFSLTWHNLLINLCVLICWYIFFHINFFYCSKILKCGSVGVLSVNSYSVFLLFTFCVLFYWVLPGVLHSGNCEFIYSYGSKHEYTPRKSEIVHRYGGKPEESDYLCRWMKTIYMSLSTERVGLIWIWKKPWNN